MDIRSVILFLFLLFMVSIPVEAQRLFGKNIDVEVSGYGIDSISAINDAKRNASEMAYKALITSKTQIENEEIKSDAIDSRSYGMIKKISIIDCINEDSITTVKIKAVVYFSKYLGGRDRVKSKIKLKSALK